MPYLRSRFWVNAALMFVSVGSIDAPVTSAYRGPIAQVRTAKEKAKPETKPSEEDESAYYVTIIGGGYLTVADDLGNSNTPLVTDAQGNEIGDFIAPRVPNVTVDVLGKMTMQVVMPGGQNYTLSFRSNGRPISIEVIKRKDTTTPERAVRYVDLVLPADARARFNFTPKGVESLRYDRDGDGTYESSVAPTIDVNGRAARDVTAPVVKFSKRSVGAKTKITIRATDTGSGVKTIYYSLDEKIYQPYVKALLLDSSITPKVYAFADDQVGNRSSVFSLAN